MSQSFIGPRAAAMPMGGLPVAGVRVETEAAARGPGPGRFLILQSGLNEPGPGLGYCCGSLVRPVIGRVRLHALDDA
jgi:hypothetical protein